MDQATQQNAALVEQASAAAQSLQQQAYELAEVVAAFRLLQGTAAQSCWPDAEICQISLHHSPGQSRPKP